MKHQNRAELVEVGLSPTEAQVYLALLETHVLSASAIATTTGLSRTAVYQILCALSDKGLVESGAGYGSKFAAVAPERALSALIAHDEEALSQRKKVAETLSQRLAALADSTEASEAVPEELIQVIRNPKVVAERFERLQLETERQIDIFTKPPFFNRTGNPAQQKALRRGVRARSLYEKAALEDPAVKPFFKDWLSTGEEARIYDGELPHKLVIFDRAVVLMPLIRPGEQTKTLLIRHPQLAQSLSLAFQYVWERAEPVAPSEPKKRSTPSPRVPRMGKQRLGSNSKHLAASAIE
jgi:sugar-specific transcriptional regulator TrmB